MLKRFIILFLLLLPLLGNAVVGQTRYEVTANTLNVRSGPGTSYPIVYKLHRGDIVVVLEQSGQWATIRGTGGRYYVNHRYLRYVGPEQTKTQTQKTPTRETVWDKLYRITKVILKILVVVAVIGFFVNESIAGLAIWML
ncbi:MAG: SH3 domain-containing protein, partial [Paludibacteraceae bacterium]|nr:SH3 domain-containing protein [Paludibacteraceae bacterium]